MADSSVMPDWDCFSTLSYEQRREDLSKLVANTEEESPNFGEFAADAAFLEELPSLIGCFNKREFN
jgi:hypothetical protein